MQQTSHSVRSDQTRLQKALAHLASSIAILLGTFALITTKAQSTPSGGTSGYFSTLAGIAGGPGFIDGSGPSARFNRPIAVTIAPSGILYVADHANHSIRQIDADGKVSTLAGKAGYASVKDGCGRDTLFSGPHGVAADSQGNVYVIEEGSFAIRRIRTIDGMVTGFAGNPGVSGRVDGSTADARFGRLVCIATDRAANVYVVDAADDRGNTPPVIRKITAAGAVSTIPLNIWLGPQVGLTIDDFGNIYLADTYNQVIRKITPTGMVSTFAGESPADFPCTYRDVDGTGSEARFYYPSGITADHRGNIYVTDLGEGSIRRVTPAGVVTTLVGSGHPSPTSPFNIFTGIAADAHGNLYVTNERNTIHKVSLSGADQVPGGSTQFYSFTDSVGPATLPGK